MLHPAGAGGSGKAGQWSVLVRGSGAEPIGTDAAFEEIYRCPPAVPHSAEPHAHAAPCASTVPPVTARHISAGPHLVCHWHSKRLSVSEDRRSCMHYISAPRARHRVRLPVNPESGRGVVLGEGKPENQNHAIIFCFNETLQAIDMNQVPPPFTFHALACRSACVIS